MSRVISLFSYKLRELKDSFRTGKAPSPPASGFFPQWHLEKSGILEGGGALGLGAPGPQTLPGPAYCHETPGTLGALRRASGCSHL